MGGYSEVHVQVCWLCTGVLPMCTGVLAVYRCVAYVYTTGVLAVCVVEVLWCIQLLGLV